ncbi:hypothetical protein EYF80_014341 [Liparis tanakae]|uniref:Uncharacterized protein n=1 Tax=Liparis tanakae TaxID=230148 RepID=A0A4Z2IBW1_9TELE|nr:hypothetical protein EYF80_014341 [Liparis tanakae]
MNTFDYGQEESLPSPCILHFIKSGGESVGAAEGTSVRTGGSGPSGERRDGRLSSVSGFSSGGFTACQRVTGKDLTLVFIMWLLLSWSVYSVFTLDT